MNSNKFSRVIALLLSLVMLLGTLPTSYAEGSPIIENAKYEAALDAVVQMYYEGLISSEVYEEALVLYGNRNWDQYDEFYYRLSEEQRGILDEKITALHEDYVLRTDIEWMIPPVNYARVAKFMPPVSAQASYDLRSGARATGSTTEEFDPDDINKNQIVLKKNVSEPDNEGKYTLTLEAYTTGFKTTSISTTEVPTDIVLVLDQSTSMTYCISCGQQATEGEVCSGDVSYVPVYGDEIENSVRAVYFRKNGSSYQQLYYCTGYSTGWGGHDAGWYNASHYNAYGQHNGYGNNGTRYTPKTSANSSGEQFYKQVPTENTVYHKIRLNALVEAVQGFVDSVAARSDSINHRIAIVGFAGQGRGGGFGGSGAQYEANSELMSITGSNNSNGVGVTYANATDNNYRDVLQSMNTATGREIVNKAVDALEANGMTMSNHGLDMAGKIFAQNPVVAGERNRVVVMFTDGTPSNYMSEYTESVAEGAIDEAYELKNTYGATVYTVGIFSGAKADKPENLPANNATDSNRENRYMHLMSSNYLQATGMSSPGPVNPNLNGGSYYLSASDSGTLSGIFKTIANQVQGGSSIKELTQQTVVKDIVAGEFTLPAGADTNDIKVYTAKYVRDGADGKKVFADREPFTDAEIDISEDGKSISVTNFSYKENWVGTEKTENEDTGVTNTVYRGKKLIIELPIVVREDFLGGNGVNTNGVISGIFEKESDAEAVEEFVSPQVNLPLKAITPVINDQHVYLSNYADLLQMISHYSDQTQYHRYQIGNNTYTIDGVNNSHVNITYAFKDADGETVATYTIPAGQTTGTFAVTDETQVLLTDSTQYSISCTVSPSTKVEGGYNDPVTSGNVPGWVYIYKPVLTFNDSKEKYLDTMTEADEQAYYAANNLVANSEAWMHGTTAAGNQMSGTKPQLTLTYTADKTWLDSNMKVISTTDVPVNVTVKVGTQDITSQTTTIRNKCELTGLDNACEHTAQTSGTANAHNPEFVVHVYDVYGHLKFSKVVSDNDTSDNKAPAADQVFTFTVTLTDKNGTPLTDEFDYTGSKEGKIKHDGTITLTAGQNVTINNLPPETKYTVTEAALIGFTSAMSVVQDYELTSQIDAGKTDELLFTNTYKVGDLKITKKIVDKNGNIVTDSNVTNDVFTFTATIGGVPQTVTITGANSTTIADIPYGTSYSVTETKLPTGYKIDDVSIVDNGTGAIVEGVSEVVVTNTYETGALKIEKVVVGSAAPDDDTFVFTVELPDGKYSMGNETLTVSGGKATVSLKGGESVTITGIPAGANYAVSEKANANYTTTMSGNTGTIEAGETQKAVFTNTYLYQYLDIKKTVTDATDTYAPTTFNFTITKDDGTSYTAQITAAEVGKEYIATVLVPTGNYTVTETANAAFATEYQVGPDKTQNITVPTGNAVSISVTNTRIMQDISVNKVWQDNNNALGLRPENITATLEAVAGGKTFAHGQSALTVAGDAWTAKWTNVPTHDLSGNAITYSVTENAVEHYNAPDYSGDATDGFVITNAIAVGDLTISKTIKDEDESDALELDTAKEFTFNVELKDASGNALENVAYTGSKTGTVSDGGTITLKHGQSVTLENLPDGATYTVEEVEEIGYTTTMNDAESTIAEGPIVAGTTAAAAFTNIFKVADLTINKNIVGGDTNTEDDVFTFVVTVGGSNVTTYYVDGVEKTAIDGKVLITAAQNAVIRDIPIKTSYSVVETDLPTGYTWTAEENVSGIIPDAGVTAKITNTYAKGGLTISKTVVGTDAPKATDEFTFTVEVKDAAGAAIAGTFEYTGSKFGSITTGTANEADRQITLKHGESVNLSGLPIGAAYTVIETEHPNYTTAMTGAEGTIAAGEAATAAFINTYQYASLTINKQFNGNDVDPDAVAMFEVTDGNGNLVATVAIKGNGSVTINHLNVGETYTVEELTDWNWRYVVTPSDGKTSIDELDLDSANNVVSFTNEKNKNQWLDDEVYVENHFTGVSPATTD